MTYERVKQGKVSDSIAQQLENLILEGMLATGERLPSERELAQQLDVSRPSLREAILKLETRGLLETRQGGGTYVKDFMGPAVTDPLVEMLHTHPNVATDFVEFRMMLEGSAAYYAALRATEADRKLLTACFEAMEDAHGLEDPMEEADIDADFHQIVAEASHNVVLLHIMRHLVGLLREGVFYNRERLYRRPGAREMLLKQHKAIYDSIMAGDPDKASTAARTHLQYVLEVTRDMEREEARIEVSERRLERYLQRKEGKKKK